MKEVPKATGLPISEALKRGLRSLREQVRNAPNRTAYEIYKELDLGPGGYAIAPSREMKRGVREALRKKLQRSKKVWPGPDDGQRANQLVLSPIRGSATL